MSHLVTIIAVLIAMACYMIHVQSVASTVVTQNDLGAVAHKLPPVYFQSHTWKGYFSTKIPCIDTYYKRNISNIMQDLVVTFAIAVDKLNASPTQVAINVSNHVDPVLNAINSTMKEIFKRSESLKQYYDYIKSEGEHVYGAVTESLCIVKDKKTSFYSDANNRTTLSDIENDKRIHGRDVYNTYLSKYSGKTGREKRESDKQPECAGSIHNYQADSKPSVEHHYYPRIETRPQTPHRDFTAYLSPPKHIYHFNDPTTESSVMPMEHSKESSSTSPVETSTVKLSPNEDSARHARDFLDNARSEFDKVKAKWGQKRRSTDMIEYPEIEEFIRSEDQIRSCFTECGNMYHSLAGQYGKITEKMIIAVNNRPKRGLFNFVSKIQNFLWGTATEEQVKKTEDHIKNLEARMTESEEHVIFLHDQFASMLNVLSDTTKSKIIEAMDKIDVIMSQVDVAVVQMEGLTESQRKQEFLLVFNSHATIISNMAIRALAIMQELEHSLNSIRQTFVQYRETMASGKFPYELVPYRYINTMLKEIENNIPSDTSIIPYNNLQTLLANSQSMGIVQDNHLIITIDIPIVVNPNSIELWSIKTIPMYTAIGWMHTQISHAFIVKDPVKNQWTDISYLDYTRCVANPLQICKHHPLWKNQNLMTCETAIAGLGGSTTDLCVLKPMTTTSRRDMYYEKVRDNEWLISLNNNSTVGNVICYNIKENKVTKKTQNMEIYSRIVLKPECSLEVLGYIMVPDVYIIGSTQVYVKNNLLPIKGDYLIEDLSFEIPKIDLRRIRSPNDNKSDTNVITLSRGATLKELIKTHNSRGAIYKNDLERLRFESENIGDIEYSKNWFESLFGSWWKKLMWICGVLLTLVIFIKLIPYIMTKRTTTAIALPLSQGIPGSYALPIQPLNTSEVAIPIKRWDDNILKGINKTVIHLSTQLEDLTLVNIMWMMLAHIVIMISVMALCHLIYHYHNKYLHMRTRLKLGYRPVNRSVTHMPGECRLYICFLVKVTCAFQDIPIYHEVVCQLCTLPGLIEGWYCKVMPDSGKLFTVSKSYRWHNVFKFPIQWGPLCLKSNQYPNLDTCQQLTGRIELKKEEVLSNKYAALPWDWIYVNAHSVTKLYLEDEKETKTLFAFNMVTTGDNGLTIDYGK